MKTVKTYVQELDAELAHCLLEGAGLHPFILDENLTGIPTPSIGFRLQVPEEEFKEASELLNTLDLAIET